MDNLIMKDDMGIGKGLNSISSALCIIGFMVLIYMLARGVVLADNLYRYEKAYRNEYEARCASLQGYYGSNKCYIGGKEI